MHSVTLTSHHTQNTTLVKVQRSVISGKKKQTGGNLYKCGVGNDFLDGIKVMSHKQKNYKLTLSKFKSSSKDTVKKIQRQATDREQAFSK